MQLCNNTSTYLINIFNCLISIGWKLPMHFAFAFKTRSVIQKWQYANDLIHVKYIIFENLLVRNSFSTLTIGNIDIVHLTFYICPILKCYGMVRLTVCKQSGFWKITWACLAYSLLPSYAYCPHWVDNSCWFWSQ